MERLIGNIWFHDDGTGEVSIYERIGRRYLPIRAESEPLPDRIAFEARQAIESKIAQMVARRASLTPLSTKLANLESQLEQFPNWTKLPEDEKQTLRDHLSAGMTDTPYQAPEPVGLPRQPTIEEVVEAANQAKQTELSDLARAQTENNRLKERLLALEAKQKVSVNGQKEEVPQGQDASGPESLLGQEARQENDDEAQDQA